MQRISTREPIAGNDVSSLDQGLGDRFRVFGIAVFSGFHDSPDIFIGKTHQKLGLPESVRTGHHAERFIGKLRFIARGIKKFVREIAHSLGWLQRLSFKPLFLLPGFFPKNQAPVLFLKVSP